MSATCYQWRSEFKPVFRPTIGPPLPALPPHMTRTFRTLTPPLLRQRGPRAWRRSVGRGALLALSCLLLSACGPELRGSPKPLPSFGPVQGAWWGCPSLEGVYAWPPVAESPGESKASARRQPATGELPFHAMGAEMQVWLRQERGETTLRTRAINRARNVRDSMARQWSLITYGSSQTHCTSGMLDLKPAHASDRGDGGDKSRDLLLGFRLALLKDGALAVGTRRLIPGGKGSYFSWGGQSYGSYDLPDTEDWSWIKLPRSASGDREPPVEDAYVPGATAP